MTTYYEQFRPAEDSYVAHFFAKRAELTNEIANIEKHLDDERNKVVRLKRHIADLDARVGEALGGSKNSYEKFRTDMTHSNRDLLISEGLITSITDKVLPKKKAALTDAELNLKNALARHLAACRPVCDEKINELVKMCIVERQDFLDCFAKIYADYNVGFLVNNESFCPGIWRADEVHDLRIRLGMAEPQQAVPGPVETPQSVQAEQSPVEAVPRIPQKPPRTPQSLKARR